MLENVLKLWNRKCSAGSALAALPLVLLRFVMLTLFSESQVLHLVALEEAPLQEVGGESSADGSLTLGCTTTKQS